MELDACLHTHHRPLDTGIINAYEEVKRWLILFWGNTYITMIHEVIANKAMGSFNSKLNLYLYSNHVKN